jgi:predicted RNA-binding Zn-ribbon protein involved in translation (DUF1610 family)
MALVPVDTTACPDCGETLDPSITDEPALVRHGGYGAMRRTIRDACGACGWSIVRSVTEVHPETPEGPS